MTTTTPWRPITPLDKDIEDRLQGDLAAVDALHQLWTDFTLALDEADRSTLRRRTLRKHAIETGIIEQLYEIDWGVTETLVAEGLTQEAIARAGGEVSPGVLAMLQAQFEGLQLATEYVREDWPLTTSFIKELHALITRAQDSYDVTDSLGRPTKAPLVHGAYKTEPNNVKRADGSLLEFAPPEQVPGEIERLVEMYNSMEIVHPVVSAAWLHHRFVQIHPFQDGNGRVARALTLLSLGRAQYPPLVVGRHQRSDYLDTLDRANDGDLTPLGRLFVKLARTSLLRELEEPVPDPVATTAKEVARAFARSLDQRQHEEAAQRELTVRIRAVELHGRIGNWFENAVSDLTAEFTSERRTVKIWTDGATPDDPIGYDEWPRTQWFRDQVVETAKRADHRALLSADRWWTRLVLKIHGYRLQFVASIHHVGRFRPTGVMAITSFGDVRRLDEDTVAHMDAFVATSWDAFTFSHDEEVDNRTAELYDWLDQSLSVALQKLMRRTLAG